MEAKVEAGSNVAFTTPKNTDMKKIEVEDLKNNEPEDTIKEEHDENAEQKTPVPDSDNKVDLEKEEPNALL